MSRDTSVFGIGHVALILFVASIVGCASTASTNVGSAPGAVPVATRSDRDYRKLEREVFAELNAVRTNPPSYATALSELLPLFSGRLLRRPGWPVPVETVEGAAAVREAIGAVRAQHAVPALSLANGLSLAARDLAADQARTGGTGRRASDGAGPTQRIARYGTWGVSYSENVDYGAFRSGRDVIEDLLIDDGVPNRGHRHNIFDPSARVVGVACGPHPRYGSVCVIDQAGAFTPR